MAACTTRSVIASDGIRLHFRHWHHDESPRATVVALHGIQSHSQWYEHSSERLADAGVDVYFADRRGSGLNGRFRGHADHGVRLLNDVRQLVRLVRREHPSLPLTLLGLSWGGKTAAALAATYPTEIDRLALLYPGLRPIIQPTWWQRFQLSFARRHDVRRHPVTIPLQDVSLFTDNPAAQEMIQDDPLALEYVTSGFVNAGRDLDDLLNENLRQIIHPVLLMLSGRDRIVDNSQTRRLVESFPSRQLTTISYRDACHTLEFAAEREEFVKNLTAWVTSHAGAEETEKPVSVQSAPVHK